MASSDFAAESQALLVESRHRIATSCTLVATTLFRMTRRRRLEGGSDAHDGGLQPSSVTINERAYHSDCWERLEARRNH